ncbi:MAG: hypothetical protein AB1733_16440 [Thermodesulfobacteriota bacterium]
MLFNHVVGYVFFFLATVYALNFELTVGEVMFIYVALIPFSLLPIRGIANIGNHEATWFLVLKLLGTPNADAAALAFGSHVLLLLVSTVIGIVPATFALSGWLFGSRPEANH